MKDTNKLYIGLDIGTTAIKVAAINSQLVSTYEKQYHYDYLTPQKDWTEIEPDTWVTIVLEGLKELFQQVPSNQITGIGITGQMHTTVFVDKHGCSVRPAIMWNDHRTKDMMTDIKYRLLSDKAAASTAKIVSTGSPLANILWVKEHEPHHYEKTAHILCAKDYVVLKLTNSYSTDYCDASVSSLYDFTNERWSDTILTLFDLDSKLFPKINYSSKIIGQLSSSIQQQTGSTHSLPMVAGTGDNVASALASGCFSHDQPLISLGTSGVVVIPNRFHQLKATGKNVEAKIIAGDSTIITQGTVQAGAKTNSWWLETILHTTDYEKAQSTIPQQLPGTNEVLFFPHLNGEKTLYSTPDLRGAFVGLSLETTREELYLAVLEGVAFGMRSLYEEMKNAAVSDYFTIVGGGAKSDLWVQLFADILNCPIKRVTAAREAVHGAAMLAIQGIEQQLDIPEDDSQLVEPSLDRSRSYNKKYRNYQMLTEMMRTYTQAVREE